MNNLISPLVILFDWHATLADTLDAMYRAVDDVLPELEDLGLMERIMDPETSKTVEDARLVDYVRNHQRLHPKIKADRKISRTDIFEVLFGPDEQAKQTAHEAFNHYYRYYYGQVYPFEDGIREMLIELRELGLLLGVMTNRNREFFEHEIAVIEGSGWNDLFHTIVCGDDVARRKPAPDPILKALENLGIEPSSNCWYVGDSTTDTVSAKSAGITSVFYNGAKWEQGWLDRIFPGTPDHPHKPDAVINDFAEFKQLVTSCEPAR